MSSKTTLLAAAWVTGGLAHAEPAVEAAEADVTRGELKVVDYMLASACN